MYFFFSKKHHNLTIYSFNKTSVIRKTVENHYDLQVKLDLRQDILTQFIKIITDMLKKSLGNRIVQIFHQVKPGLLNWSINEKRPRPGSVIFGLRINPEFAYNIIDKGPVANLPEVNIYFFPPFNFPFSFKHYLCHEG